MPNRKEKEDKVISCVGNIIRKSTNKGYSIVSGTNSDQLVFVYKIEIEK